MTHSMESKQSTHVTVIKSRALIVIHLTEMVMSACVLVVWLYYLIAVISKGRNLPLQSIKVLDGNPRRWLR